MATHDLISIRHHLNSKIFSGLTGRAKLSPDRHGDFKRAQFKNILSEIQSRHPIKKIKTRGLTIADYRARPVVSKSRFRAQPQQLTREFENRAARRIPAYTSSTKDNLANIKRPGDDRRQTESADSAERVAHESRQQSPSITGRQMIEESVQRAAAKYNLEPGLIKAVIRAESNFQVEAVSHAGARGLMQLMPATARELGVTDIFDIDQNIDGGAKYLRRMLDRFDGNIRKALSAYNAGPGTVVKYNGRVPYPETRQYVQRVLRFSGQMA
jgi:soluble lytic murein transglycosylase-like protein